MLGIPVLLIAVQLGQGQTASVKPQSFNDTRQTGLIDRSGPLGGSAPIHHSRNARQVFMARKMFREAADMYRQMSPGRAVAWNKMGVAHHRCLDLGSTRRSTTEIDQAPGKLPRGGEQSGNGVKYARKSYRRAIGCYRRALKINPMSGHRC